mmetsp:Transcript_35090/g.59144  ORF Transcript_35090/g.59144 Transcript_35090/m.59144 type:complete len:97 (-) Transcript_35090:260-550(-)
MANELATLTGNSVEKITADLGRDFYLSSFEAVEYGLIDRVLMPRDDKIPEAMMANQREAELSFGNFDRSSSGFAQDFSTDDEDDYDPQEMQPVLDN